MRRHSVRLLALIAILPALFLLSPPRASYACTAEYPPEYFETHTFTIPTLPEGIEVITDHSEIADSLDMVGIGEFTYEKAIPLRGNPGWIELGLIAVTNLSSKSVYVLASADEYIPSPYVTKVAPSANVPDGFLPLFTVDRGEGLLFSEWYGIASGYVHPWSQPTDDSSLDFVNDTVVRLYHDGQMIEVGVTFIFTYNKEYLSESMTIDKSLDECQRMQGPDYDTTSTPTPQPTPITSAPTLQVIGQSMIALAIAIGVVGAQCGGGDPDRHLGSRFDAQINGGTSGVGRCHGGDHALAVAHRLRLHRRVPGRVFRNTYD